MDDGYGHSFSIFPFFSSSELAGRESTGQEMEGGSCHCNSWGWEAAALVISTNLSSIFGVFICFLLFSH